MTPALIDDDLHFAMQEATAAEEHSSLLLLLCGGLPAACFCIRHKAAAGVDSGALGWQCCAVDLLHPHATVHCPQSAAGASYGSGDGPLHGMSCSLHVASEGILYMCMHFCGFTWRWKHDVDCMYPCLCHTSRLAHGFFGNTVVVARSLSMYKALSPRQKIHKHRDGTLLILTVVTCFLTCMQVADSASAVFGGAAFDLLHLNARQVSSIMLGVTLRYGLAMHGGNVSSCPKKLRKEVLKPEQMQLPYSNCAIQSEYEGSQQQQSSCSVYFYAWPVLRSLIQ